MEAIEEKAIDLNIVEPAGGVVLPRTSTNIIKQVLAFLSSLDRTRCTPTVSIVQSSGAYPIVAIDPKMDEASRTNVFPY